jgi:hypothetical protein
MATGLQGFTGILEEQLLRRVSICTFKTLAMFSTIYPSIGLLKRICLLVIPCPYVYPVSMNMDHMTRK